MGGDVTWSHEAPAPLIVLDASASILDANGLAATELGLEPSELRGGVLVDLIADVDVAELGVLIKAVPADTDAGASQEVVVHIPGAPPRAIELRLKRATDDTAVAHVDDVTDELRTHVILAKASRAVYLLDEAGIWGPIGYDERGQPWTLNDPSISVARLVHPDDLGMVLDSYAAALRQLASGSRSRCAARARHAPAIWGTITAQLMNLLDDTVVGGLVLRIFWEHIDEQHVTSLGARPVVDGSFSTSATVIARSEELAIAQAVPSGPTVAE